MANTNNTHNGPPEAGHIMPPMADSKKLGAVLMEEVNAEMDIRNISLEDAYFMLTQITPYDFDSYDHPLISRLITVFNKHSDEEIIFCEAYAQLVLDLKKKLDAQKTDSITTSIGKTLQKFLHSSTKPS